MRWKLAAMAEAASTEHLRSSGQSGIQHTDFLMLKCAINSWAGDHQWWVLVGLLLQGSPRAIAAKHHPKRAIQPHTFNQSLANLQRAWSVGEQCACRKGLSAACTWHCGRKGPQVPPTQPLQGTKKINLCYRGFNKWRFDIVHLKPPALMSSSSSWASRLWSWSSWWGWQPRPQLAILLLGTGAQMHYVLHQLLMEPKHSEGWPNSQKPAGFECPLHWQGSPCRAAPGHRATVSTGPSIPLWSNRLHYPFPRMGFLEGISVDAGSVWDELVAENPFCPEPKADLLKPCCWLGHTQSQASAVLHPWRSQQAVGSAI